MDSGDAEAPDSAPHPAGAIEGREAPERTDPAQDHPGPAPDERDEQIAEHVRYRLSVDASYKAAEARSSWTEAAPVLRAEWEAHKGRYPDRERQTAATLPDGSWHGDGDRRLSPEQNAEASKCAADLRDEAIQRIGPAMERVEAADPNRRLAGRAHMLKGEDRLKEKMADELLATRCHGTASARQNRRRRPVHLGIYRQNATLRVSSPTSIGSRRKGSD